MLAFMAYENEKDTLVVTDMTIENRLDRISIYGSVDLTKDKHGLEHALILKRVIDASIDALKREKNLPEDIYIKAVDSVNNPF